MLQLFAHQSEHSSHWIIRSSGLYGISHLQNLAHVLPKEMREIKNGDSDLKTIQKPNLQISKDS